MHLSSAGTAQIYPLPQAVGCLKHFETDRLLSFSCFSTPPGRGHTILVIAPLISNKLYYLP
jgi:hypothetical protein